MFSHTAYIIETLTNTHVGSGDTTFGVVDCLVQKDPVTQVPVFHSSSIKGALNDHMKENNLDDTQRKLIFGEAEDKPGEVKFYEARLITLPLRANRRVYYNCTSPSVMLDYIDTLKQFKGISVDVSKVENFFACMSEGFNENTDFYIFHNGTGEEIEDYDSGKWWQTEFTDDVKSQFKSLTGISIETVAVFRNNLFRDICSDSLPVIARNQLDNQGISENLFYEEVLPRRSRLWFIMGWPGNGSIDSTDFETKLKEIVQLGGNASVGYGATRFHKIQIGGAES